MTTVQDAHQLEWEARSDLMNPFAEASPAAQDAPVRTIGFAPWSESLTPFTDVTGGPVGESESDRLLAEAFAELRDEAFDEAVAYLTEETEQAVADRFTNESPSSALERERFADAQLSSVRFEAQQYLDALETGLTGMDVESLTDEQLDEVLDRLDPQTSELTPAGEEFVGALVRKAKKAIKFVAKAAKSVGKVAGAVVAKTAKGIGKVAGAVLGPVLKRLRGLINPLLRRVLSFAIGRLPTPLQPAARTLAARITSEAGEEENLDETPMSPTNLTDVEALAESFDAALAEAMTSYGEGDFEGESLESRDSEAGVESRELELLAEARGVLIDRLRTANDEEDLGPAVEQFVPALLGALRLGINLVGRPKVVGFLARYLGQLIRRWVGPKLSGPLSNAIVDTGLRLISLESESGEVGGSRTDEAGPVALASVIEDSVRRLAENEEYIFENEDLMQLAAADAFSQAVATHFPPRFVRPGLQQAPSLGGTFVARRPRSVRTYRKYSRTPEVEVTAPIADALRTFDGSTLGAVLRAAGATFPIRAHMHIYQSAAGTTLPRMIRQDRATSGGGRSNVMASNVHPLTPAAAGLLLREPGLGVAVPPTYLRSRHRIAVGQRFYALEPIGAAGALALPTSATTRAAAARLAPSRAWTVVDLRRLRITVGLYLSEAEAQSIVAAIRQGRGGPALLQALTATYRATDRSASNQQGHFRIVREDSEDFENLAARTGRLLPSGFAEFLRRRLRAWVLPALATWARTNSEAFTRAAAHPDAGVTIRVQLTSVPGLDLLGQTAKAVRGGSFAAGALSALRGTPTITVSIAPGRRRR
jgi:hypothetical protein